MADVPYLARQNKTVGLVLAGGLATRMGGGDKGMRHVAGKTVLQRVLDRFGPQVARVAISANGDPARLAAYGLPVLADWIDGHPGPLAGVLAGLEWAAMNLDAAWVVTVPVDAPFLPPNLVARFHAERADAPCACAASAGRRPPVLALWQVAMRVALRDFLNAGGRKVGAFAQGAAIVDWPAAPIDPFFNVNTPDDLALANRLALKL